VDPSVGADEVTSAVTKARSIFWAMSALAFAASADSFAATDMSLLSRELFFNNCSCHQNMMAWMAATTTNDPVNNIIHQSTEEPDPLASLPAGRGVSVTGFGAGLDDSWLDVS
jgi:hypothetical protein